MSNPHVVVVGGTKGLGRVVTQTFLDAGACVTVLSRSAPTEWEGTAPLHLPVDLETLGADAAQAVAKAVVSAGGPIRYLVFSQRYRGNSDSWAGELQVSLVATDLLMDAFAEHFVPAGDRAIAVVSSVYAEFVGPSQPAIYHVAKAGLNQLVRHRGWTLGRRGIRVNAIMPLTYLKPESRSFYLSNKELLDVYSRFVPLGRLGEAAECASVFTFLCSEGASFVNGQCLYVDGGVSVRWPEGVAREFFGQ